MGWCVSFLGVLYIAEYSSVSMQQMVKDSGCLSLFT